MGQSSMMMPTRWASARKATRPLAAVPLDSFACLMSDLVKVRSSTSWVQGNLAVWVYLSLKVDGGDDEVIDPALELVDLLVDIVNVGAGGSECGDGLLPGRDAALIEELGGLGSVGHHRRLCLGCLGIWVIAGRDVGPVVGW